MVLGEEQTQKTDTFPQTFLIFIQSYKQKRRKRRTTANTSCKENWF